MHGFNVSFDQAAIRAAQIGFDLDLPGITAFYSWPSLGGGIKRYPADVENINASARQLTEFFVEFSKSVSADKIHVIAHSMGCRGMSEALGRINGEAERVTGKKFSQIVLAAPDIDVRVFSEFSQAYVDMTTKTTCYSSSKDRALGLSRIINDCERVGFHPPISLFTGIDTVDVSELDVGILELGHGYIAESEKILADMFSLFRSGMSPDHRFGVKKVENNSGDYWKIKA